MNRDFILETQDIHHSFGRFKVLQGVSIKVPYRQVTALIGPNGAGKTTFYNIISGRYKPTKGKVIFEGKEITQMPAHKRIRIGLSRSFQITNIFSSLTVIENIMVPIAIQMGMAYIFYKRLKNCENLYQRAYEVLKLIGLQDKALIPANQLSYGDKRLVEIAIALAINPRLILLDEPTAGMNPEETDRMIGLIKDLAQETEATFLITEHDMKVVFSLAEYMYVLHQGALLAEGLPQEIRENKAVKEAYLGGSLDA